MNGTAPHKSIALVEPEGWRNSASCPQTDPEAFFGPIAGRRYVVRTLCSKCPVRELCRDSQLALPPGERWGVWGGWSWDATDGIRPYGADAAIAADLLAAADARYPNAKPSRLPWSEAKPFPGDEALAAELLAGART